MNFLKEMSPVQACLIGLFIAGIAFVFVFKGLSQDKQIKTLKNKKSQLYKKNSEADTLIEEAKAYKKQLESLGNTINKVIKYIPKDMSSSKMMKSLTDSAKLAGVNIIGVSETRGRKNNSSELYEEVPVNINLEGNFTQIMVFIAKLTELENIVTMKKFVIKSKSRTNEGMISFAATFIGYKYKSVIDEVK